MMAEELPKPLGKEIGRAYEQHSLGMSMEDAIDRVTAAIENMREPGYATVIVTRARA